MSWVAVGQFKEAMSGFGRDGVLFISGKPVDVDGGVKVRPH